MLVSKLPKIRALSEIALFLIFLVLLCSPVVAIHGRIHREAKRNGLGIFCSSATVAFPGLERLKETVNSCCEGFSVRCLIEFALESGTCTIAV